MTSWRPWLFLWAVFLLPPSTLKGQDLRWGASLRGYQFIGLEDSPFAERRDSELWLLRVTPEASWGNHISFQVHGLLSVLSPPLSGASRIALADSRKFLPLDHDFTDSSSVDLLGSFDRLNLQLQFEDVRVTVGRQAVSWGVSFFWPAMDLFAPFAPRQIDREYKAGVDALRVTVPIGSFSEFEIIGASLGASAAADGAAAALLRLNLGSADVGLMGGKFHRDVVAGAFLTADLKGTGVRGELTWTQSGDVEDLNRDRQRFLRGSLGILRQLTSSTSLTLELALNGYGTTEVAEYQTFLSSDRILRGEVNALARTYLGASVNWLLHPLFNFSHTLLVNWDDRSSLWIPTLVWSTGNNSEVLFGGQLGVGEALTPSGMVESEYGSVPNTVFAAVRLYF